MDLSKLSDSDLIAFRDKDFSKISTEGLMLITGKRPTSRTWGEAAVDVGAGLTKGIGSLVQLPSQAAGLITGDMEAGPVGRLGKSIEEYGQSLKSPYLRSQEEQQQKLVQEAYEKSGVIGEFGQAFKGTVTNPALFVATMVEQVPNFIGSLGTGLLAKIGVKTAARLSTGIIDDVAAASVRAGVGTSLATNALMQGTDVGAETYQSVYDRLKEVAPQMSDDERREIALSKGRAAGAAAAGISLGLTRLPGSQTIEKALLGKTAADIEKGASKGLLRRTAEGFGGEALSEGIEEGPGGQLLTNVALRQVDPNQPLGQGVGAATALGAITGGVFGGAAGAISRDTRPPEAKTLDAQFQDAINHYQEQGLSPVEAYNRVASELTQVAPAGSDVSVYNSLGRQFEASVVGKDAEGKTVIKVDGDDSQKTFILGNEYTLTNPADVRYGIGVGENNNIVSAQDLNDKQLQEKIDEYEARLDKHEAEYEKTGIETPEFINDKRVYTALTSIDKLREEDAAYRKPVEEPEAAPAKKKPAAKKVAQPAAPQPAATQPKVETAAAPAVAPVVEPSTPAVEAPVTEKKEAPAEAVAPQEVVTKPIEEPAPQKSDLAADAEKIRQMSDEERDNTPFADLPGGYHANNLYEAQKVLPNPSENIRKVTDKNTNTLGDEFDYIANVDGVHYGITAQEEDPDTGQKVFSYQNISSLDSPFVGTFIPAKNTNVAELIKEIRSGTGKESRAPGKKKKKKKEEEYKSRQQSQQRIGKMREKEEKALYERALPRIAKLVEDRMNKLGLGKYVKKDLQAKLKTRSGDETNGSYLEKLIKLAIAGKSDKQIMSTLNHESIHALKELGMITPDEWKNLKQIVDKRGWIKKFSIEERYKDLDPEEKYEEAIADAFATYATGRSPVLGYSNGTPVYVYKKDLNLAGQPVGIINRILKVLRLIKDTAAEDAVFKRLETPIESTTTKLEKGAERFSVAPSIAKNIVKNNEGYWVYKGKLPETFYKWFGDSLIVDKDGYPRIMFHGTAADISEFKPKQAGAIFITDDEKFADEFSNISASWMEDHAEDLLSKDLLSKLREGATDSDGELDEIKFVRSIRDNLPSRMNIMPLFVRAERPFDFTDPKQVQEVLEKYKEIGGRAGITPAAFSTRNNWQYVEDKKIQEAIRALGYDGFYTREQGIVNLAVYDPNQVKSVTGNSGEYSRESKSIRRSVAAKDLNAAYASKKEVDAVRSILPVHPEWREHLEEKLVWDEKDTGDYKNDRIVFEEGNKKLVVGRITPQDWIDRVELMLKPEEIVEARDWYKNIKSEFQRMFGDEWPKYMVSYLLGNKAESPRGALNNTLYVAEEIKTMTSGTRKGGLSDEQMRQIFRGEKVSLVGIGAKLYDFVDSALGKTTRSWMGNTVEGNSPFVVDRHTFRDSGRVDPALLSYIRENFGEDAAREVVLDSPSTGTVSHPQYEKITSWGNELADNLNSIKYIGGNWTPFEAQAVGWMAMSRLTETAAGGTTEGAFDAMTKTVPIELDFGAGAPYNVKFKEWHDLSPEAKSRVTYKVMREVAEVVSEFSGTKIRDFTEGLGGWGPYVNPNAIIRFLASDQTAESVAAMAAYLAHQTKVLAFHPASGQTGDSVAFDIAPVGNTPFSNKDVAEKIWPELFKYLDPIMGRDEDGNPNVGFVQAKTSDGRPAIRIIANLPTGVFLSGPKKGLPKNVKDLTVSERTQSEKTLVDKISPVINAAIQNIDGKYSFDYGRVKIVSSTNNWKEQESGDSHKQRVEERFGPVLQRRLDAVGVPRVEAAIQKAINDERQPNGERYSIAGRELTRDLQKEGAVAGEGVHFSTTERGTLSSEYFGTGYKGAELARVMSAEDPRIKQRIYFYVNSGRGINPEKYVGGVAHKANLENLYDMQADSLDLLTGNSNADESAILDAGFDGYVSREAGVAVLLGKRIIPVEIVKGKPEAEVIPQAAPGSKQKLIKAFGDNKLLPSGQMTGAEWKKELKNKAPDLAEMIDLSKIDDEGMYYKNDLWRSQYPSFKKTLDEKYSTAIAYPDEKRENWAVVPDTPFYLANKERDDLARYDNSFIQLLIGSDAQKYGMDHIMHNAVRDAGRRWENVTDSDEENTIRGIIQILGSTDLKAYQETSGKVILRSGKFKRAIVLGRRRDGWSIITVVPSDIPKFGKPIDENPNVKLAESGLFTRATPFNGTRIRYVFKQEKTPVQVAIKKKRTFEIPKASVAPKLNTIEINGVARPTTNSNGQPIHPTEDGIRNFWKWFGDSKVVDAEGRPLVVYHGTSKDIDFKSFKIGQRGAWFTSNPTEASLYASENDSKTTKTDDYRTFREINTADRVIPVYLRITNPYTPNAADGNKLKTATDYAKAQREVFMNARWKGYNGVNMGGDVWVAFVPTQIKSAIGNSGEFDESNKDISRSVAPKLNVSPYISATGAFGGRSIPTTFTTPATKKLTDHIYTWADKFIDLKNLQKEIEKTTGAIEDQYNAYQKEELYHGKVAKQTLDFMREEVRPLFEAMKDEDITPEKLNDYLLNRHAEERNDQIDSINQGVVQGIAGKGSGISTQDARSYLNGLSQQEKASLDRLAKMVDNITKKTRDLMVKAGLEEKETVDAWERTYKYYVPLERVMGDPDEENTGFTGQGQGYSVRKNVKRALGSTLDVEHILANILATRERTIVRAEKNEIGKAIYGLALKSPNPNVWIAVDPDLPKNKIKNLASLLATYAGFTVQDAQNIASFPLSRSIDRQTGLVTKGRNPLLAKADNVLHLMIDGKEKLVFFNPRNKQSNRLVRTIKNLDVANLARGLQTVGAITRYFSAVNTQYNPIFGVVNLLRDVQTGLINLESTPISGMQKKVLGDFMPAIKGIWSQLRAEAKGGNATGTWSNLFKEFEEVGGPTGYRDMFANADDRAKMIEKELKSLNQGKIKKGLVGIGEMLSSYNTAFENGVRLAAYKAARDRGLSKEQSASIAKNLTVNFNRKGDIALQAGALYAFFNASVQGTSRILQTMAKVENGKLVITPLGKKIIHGGLLLGVIQAVMFAAAGYDDENPPQFVREKNIVIPLSNGKYLTVPMPLGFNLIPNLSRNITEWAMSGFKDTPKRIISLTEAVLTGLNPFGGGFSAQTLVPTVIDPVIALAENKDAFGRRIAKEDFSTLRETPGYLRTKDTATPWSKGISEFLNYASGGTKYMKGAFSPTPDQIDYLIGQATGGVGREIGKIAQTVTSSVTGEELPSTKIPLVSRFYGDTEESASQRNKYFTNLSRINAYAAEIKGRREHPGTGTVTEFIKDVPEARLVPLATSTYSAIQKLEKFKRQAIERDLPKDRVRNIEKLIQERMKQFNKRVDSFRE